MKIFNVFSAGFWRDRTRMKHNIKEKTMDEVNLPIPDHFSMLNHAGLTGDSYLLNAWVNIAVGILIRNTARANFVLTGNGNEITGGPLFELFRRPNETMSRYDLWKETAAWWHLEGEAFWWFGPDYSGGIPKVIYVLDPRRMRNEDPLLRGVDDFVIHKNRRWFYQTDTDLIPILRDELIHFRDWPSTVSHPVRPFRAACGH